MANAQETFIIAFENCPPDEIDQFLKFLTDYKCLLFPNGTKTHSIDGRRITFAEINFVEDFMERSEYIDRLKFQLPVKRESAGKRCRNPSKETLLEIDDIESQTNTDENSTHNDTSLLGKARRLIEWIITSVRGDDEILMKDIRSFDLRRNNTQIFNEEDLRSYLTYGTILQSILNDEMDYEVEYFLRHLKMNIETSTENNIDDILDDEKYQCSNFRKIIRELNKKINGDSLDNKMKKIECVDCIVGSEIAKFEIYNSLRNKIVVFPLHEVLHSESPLKKWIQLKNSLGRQPLFEIKRYFGVKVATYFAWAGFYTYMLVIASILGLLCFIIGLIVVPYSKLAEDICKTDVIMCPRCDKWCDYWRLRDTCFHSILHHAIDNFATIIYSLFMSIWAAVYLRQWQRYIAKYNAKWDVINFDYSSQFSRGKYVKNVRRLLGQQNQTTLSLLNEQLRPKVSKSVKVYRITISFIICILWVSLSLGMVFALLLYRMSLITSEKLYGDRNSYSIYVVPISTAILDLIGIQILNYVYGKIAIYLTEIELQRTETEYENSLSIKLFMFQFVNYYSAIFYIAIFKGKFIGTPAKYVRVFGFRQEECNPGGCLVELAIQLGIIMTGRQAIKLVTPHIINIYQKIKTSLAEMGRKTPNEEMKVPDYLRNYNLKKFDYVTLIPEYLEMVIQFGFVTLFVAAFPLAPLFALLNNIFEVRLDGRKFLKEYRRSMPSRVKGIGVWLKIMSVITRIAAASNAVIIAFSSHFVPKLVYKTTYSPNHNFRGYLNHSLAVFDVKDFEEQSRPMSTEFGDISKCYYLQYRNPPDDIEDKYKKPVVYWHMLAAKLAFIVFYQFFISLIVIAVEYAVPSVPHKVKKLIRRHDRFMLDMEIELNSANSSNSINREIINGAA